MHTLSSDFFLFQISTEFCAVFAGGAVLDLPECFNKVAAVREPAFQTDLAGLQPGGAQQLGGLFYPELLDVQDIESVNQCAYCLGGIQPECLIY